MTIWDWLLAKIDVLLLILLPPSLLGALFGDTMRKDVLSLRQRGVAFAVMAVLGIVSGASMSRAWGWDYYGACGITILISSLGTDLVGLIAGLLRWGRENPEKVKDLLAGLIPWRPR